QHGRERGFRALALHRLESVFLQQHGDEPALVGVILHNQYSTADSLRLILAHDPPSSSEPPERGRVTPRRAGALSQAADSEAAKGIHIPVPAHPAAAYPTSGGGNRCTRVPFRPANLTGYAGPDRQRGTVDLVPAAVRYFCTGSARVAPPQ